MYKTVENFWVSILLTSEFGASLEKVFKIFMLCRFVKILEDVCGVLGIRGFCC